MSNSVNIIIPLILLNSDMGKKADSLHLNKDNNDNFLDLLIKISDEKCNEKIKEEINKIIKKS